MTKAPHAAISAVYYFLVPLALCVGLVVIGTFTTGYLFTTNLLIAIVVLCGFFVAVFLSLVRKSHVKAFALVCSVSLVASCYWYFVGQDRIRRYLYVAQVLTTPHFDQKCVPADGILFNGDTFRVCSAHDFNLAGWIDLIVRIDGSYPQERLIDDFTSRNIDPAASKELSRLGTWAFVFVSPNMITGQHLVSDYYLLRYHLCGNANPYC